MPNHQVTVLGLDTSIHAGMTVFLTSQGLGISQRTEIGNQINPTYEFEYLEWAIYMDHHANYLINRLSLRQPQAESLNLLARLADVLNLQKACDLADEQGKINALMDNITQETGNAKVFAEFEREFPCCCFALATGVGKTRLMGAFVSYLYLAKSINNFFVLAPNLTIYNKLIEDFSNSRSPKYVFPGTGEFVHDPPLVITGENYSGQSNLDWQDESIKINIFNISKINAETKGGKQPRIKRLSEYIGQSYFDYLAGLDDLVLLMDESHHYRAERGMQVINELRPVLGIELTATPKTETGGSKLFKNIVYQYGLGAAIREGLVKEPAVATRENFDPKQLNPDELDKLKLEDGLSVHEDTKIALKQYANDSGQKLVKPFVLIVTKDTAHAANIKSLIQSKAFCDGRYADKVMEIHSNQKGEEKDDNIKKLLALENADNPIEIVIHVNMLKEGWDVTNLYTIIPLRLSASETLTEQTIGRGLRLPYQGKRTGVDKVDKLTIIAHDSFQKILEEANKPDSIIQRKNIILINPDPIGSTKEVIVAKPVFQEKLDAEKQAVEAMPESGEKSKAIVQLAIKQAVHQAIPELSLQISNVQALSQDNSKALLVEKVKDQVLAQLPMPLTEDELVKEIQGVYQTTVDEYIQHTMEIPRIIIQPCQAVESFFEEFDLDAGTLKYQEVSDDITIQHLQNQQSNPEKLKAKYGEHALEPVPLILNELIYFPQIDYDQQADLLHKLVGQALDKIRADCAVDKWNTVIRLHKREIAAAIYEQMMKHYHCQIKSYHKPIVKPFVKIEGHHLAKIQQDHIHHFADTITPVSDIPKKVFNGFAKACHSLYQFDSKPEKDMAGILEKDDAVMKWLRPAPKQFTILWDHNARQYEPDFVIETLQNYYLAEVKADNEMDSPEVKEKAKAACIYCQQASEHNTLHGGKPWKYLLIPQSKIQQNYSFGYIAGICLLER